MRKIIFRAQDFTGTWRYGFIVKDNETAIIIPVNKNGSVMMGIFFYVKPETVGQYTGLKDNNGKEIYEGDIMRDDEGHVCKVVWDEFGCGFRQYDHYLELMDNFIEEEFDEVIGNIHDNPELLKED